MSVKKPEGKIRFLLFIFFAAVHIAFASAADIPQGLVSFAQIAKQTDSVLYWDSMSSSGVFEKNGHSLAFSAHNDFVLLDYAEVSACPAPVNYNGTFYAPAAFSDTVKRILENIPPEVHFRIGAILIDPGHGGIDPGAVADHKINGKKQTLREKDIVLFTARDLYERLKQTYPDKKILLTRSDDTYPSLEERVEMANKVPLKKNEAILYISIHANASLFNKASYGFEIWYLPTDYRRDLIDKNTASKEIAHILNIMLEEEFSTESILIAKNISDGLEAQIGKESKNRGLKEKEWFVVRNAKMPSVLIELGFVTNPEEAKRLNTPSYLQKCAQGIYNGLTAFISRFEGQ